jgi:hypothetical protein
MTNHMPFVAVATVCYVNYINLSIYICTQSLLKSLDKRALHFIPLLEEYAECIYYLSECPVTPCCHKLFEIN